MLAFSNDYYGMIFRATQSVELFCAYIEDADKRQEELDKLNATQEEWKLRAMGTTIGCHTVIKKGTEGNEIKTYNLT